MNRLITIFLFLISFTSISSQEISYGITLNSSFKYLEVKTNSIFHPAAGSQDVGFKLGGFGEFKIKNKYGIKLNLLFGKIEDTYYKDITERNAKTTSYSSSVVEIDALFKYSINNNYRKGTYLTLGGKLIFVKDNMNNVLDNPYKSANYGILLGVGKNLLKHFEIELIAFRGLGKYLEIEKKNYYLSAMINLTINLESILNRK